MTEKTLVKYEHNCIDFCTNFGFRKLHADRMRTNSLSKNDLPEDVGGADFGMKIAKTMCSTCGDVHQESIYQMSKSANLIATPARDLSIRHLDIPSAVRIPARVSGMTLPAWLRGELVRKSLHMLIAFVPSIVATAGIESALALLSLGTLVFAVSEYLRLNGRSIAIITPLTIVASRGRARDGFVLGPVTLALGAMLALLLYPSTAAALAIYALAFGDGVASLFGRAFGRIPIIARKTLEGSLACFATVWFVTLLITGRVGVSLAIAASATILEALPTGDMDNVILPAGVGLVATFIL